AGRNMAGTAARGQGEFRDGSARCDATDAVDSGIGEPEVAARSAGDGSHVTAGIRKRKAIQDCGQETTVFERVELRTKPVANQSAPLSLVRRSKMHRTTLPSSLFSLLPGWRTRSNLRSGPGCRRHWPRGSACS